MPSSDAKKRSDKRQYTKNKTAIRKRQAEYYTRTRDRQIANATRYYWTNRVRELRKRVLRKYGLSMEDFRSMRKRQAGKCAICRKPFRNTPNIDHDHATGRVRGLLCRPCNHGLGNFKDNRSLLNRAIRYLKCSK